MSAGVHVVTVGAGALALGDAESGAIVSALARAGIPVAARVFIDEDDGALEQALAAAGGLTVIVAGGGSSAGDIVRRVLARAAGVRLTLNDRMLAAIEEVYHRRDRPMPRRAERLALLPQGAVLWTGSGEPAWTLESSRGTFVVLPRGGDATREPGTEQQLVALARARLTRGAVIVRTLKTSGVSVSDVEDRLVDLLGRDGDVAVLVLPLEGEVWVRLRARGATIAEASQTLDATEASVASALGDDCFGTDGDTLEQVVGVQLKARRLTLAVAESCTGGLLGHRLTNVAGSSAYFERGVIVYSNDAKMELLGVPESILRTHGAVSAPTAEAMVRGVCAMAGTACGLAITGIAGPDGGTPTKPVGTVFIGLGVQGNVSARRFQFQGDRHAIKWQSSQMALDMLRRYLGGMSQ